ncbi:MAG: hypothetical protein ACOYVK_02825 [Bacillota bacterium]
MFNKLKEFLQIHFSLISGEIDYGEYSSYFRRKDNVIILFIITSLFTLIMGLIYEIPIYVIIGGIVIMGYGMILQSKAKTVKQQLFYSFIWGITSFLTAVIILFISIKFFNFMK